MQPTRINLAAIEQQIVSEIEQEIHQVEIEEQQGVHVSETHLKTYGHQI